MSLLRGGALALGLGLVAAGPALPQSGADPVVIPWIDMEVVDGQTQLRALVSSTAPLDLSARFELRKEDAGGRVSSRQARTLSILADTPAVIGQTSLSLTAGGTLTARVVVTYGAETAEAELTLTAGGRPNPTEETDL